MLLPNVLVLPPLGSDTTSHSPTDRSSKYICIVDRCVSTFDIAPAYPAAPQPCLLAISGFRDVEKWRRRATASLGNKTHQRWLHPCLVSKLTAPAPSTLIPSEPVNRFLSPPLSMAAPLFLPQMETPEMAPALWLGWLGGSTSPSAPFVPHDATLAAPLLVGSDVSVCGLHFTKVWCKNLNAHSSLEPWWPV